MNFYSKAALLAAAFCYWPDAASLAGSTRIHTRDELSETKALAIYEHEVMLRDRDPQKFDEIHKLGGQLLSSNSVYEKLLAEWEAHPRAFEREHECVWRVLVGDMYYHKLHPDVPATVVTGGGPPGQPEGGEPPGDGGPPDSGNPPPGGILHGASVPEPSSILLLGAGLAIVSLARAHRPRK